LDLTVTSPTLRNAAKANKKAAENITCFCHFNGKFLTRYPFYSILSAALRFLNYDVNKFNTSPTLRNAAKANKKAAENITCSYIEEQTCINSFGNCCIIDKVIGSLTSYREFNIS
jgi:hypothetical protein